MEEWKAKRAAKSAEEEELSEIAKKEKEHIVNMRDENLRLRQNISPNLGAGVEANPPYSTPPKATPRKQTPGKRLFSPAKSPITMQLVLTPVKRARPLDSSEKSVGMPSLKKLASGKEMDNSPTTPPSPSNSLVPSGNVIQST